MLTGDKLETATSIGRSSKLISKMQTLFTFKQVSELVAGTMAKAGFILEFA